MESLQKRDEGMLRYKCTFYALGMLEIQTVVIVADSISRAIMNACKIRNHTFKNTVKFKVKKMKNEDYEAWINSERIKMEEMILDVSMFFRR